MNKNYIFMIIFLFFAGCKKEQRAPLPAWREPALDMEFVLIPKGKFYVGDSKGQPDNINNTLHLVTLTNDFWLSRTEVTREQWEKVMGAEETHPEKPNPFNKDDPKYPVVSKSYFEVLQFLKKLEKLSPGNRFRLPTEAEWEYACRAGTKTNFSTGAAISDKDANFNSESASAYSPAGKFIGHPAPVGSYPPNPWGLYDMHGNTWEWTSDWYAPFTCDSTVNPTGPDTGQQKVMRGGSWYFYADNARSNNRGTHYPDLWGFSIGFRIVREKDNIK